MFSRQESGAQRSGPACPGLECQAGTVTWARSPPAHFLDGSFRNTGLTWQLASIFPATPALTCQGWRLAQPGHWLGRWAGRGDIKRETDGAVATRVPWPPGPTALINKQGLPDTLSPGLRGAPGVTPLPPAWPWGSLSPSLG